MSALALKADIGRRHSDLSFDEMSARRFSPPGPSQAGLHSEDRTVTCGTDRNPWGALSVPRKVI